MVLFICVCQLPACLHVYTCMHRSLSMLDVYCRTAQKALAIDVYTVKNFCALGAPNWCCAQWTPKFGAHSLHLICEYNFSFVCGVMNAIVSS